MDEVCVWFNNVVYTGKNSFAEKNLRNLICSDAFWKNIKPCRLHGVFIFWFYTVFRPFLWVYQAVWITTSTYNLRRLKTPISILSKFFFLFFCDFVVYGTNLIGKVRCCTNLPCHTKRGRPFKISNMSSFKK